MGLFVIEIVFFYVKLFGIKQYTFLSQSFVVKIYWHKAKLKYIHEYQYVSDSARYTGTIK